MRRHVVNGAPVRADRPYVLYWMTAHRRAAWNFALDAAVDWARELRKPLLVLDALRCDYSWASDRLHTFALQGMREVTAGLEHQGVHHYRYVEPRPRAGRGLLAALARDAAVVITDDFPAYIIPVQIRAAAAQLDVRFEKVDSNGLLPMHAAPQAFPTAHAFRRFLQKTLHEYLPHAPSPNPLRRMPDVPEPVVNRTVRARWPSAKAGPGELPIDHSVPPVGLSGGIRAARQVLARFLRDRLDRYDDPRRDALDEVSSGLSPYLHFGHISAHEVFACVMRHAGWLGQVPSRGSGAKEGWWSVPPAVEAFLDELITWRELGFNTCVHRLDYDRYESLPGWARATLDAHAGDPRPHHYSREELEAARTHDPLWNAAQRQLTRDGRMHSYLRMLWGKKVLEWTRSPREALDILVELNNKYALDGRDPNSYSGIFWVLGRYDRPWPERPIFGTVRYMSSVNAARKLTVAGYLEEYGPRKGPRAKRQRPNVRY